MLLLLLFAAAPARAQKAGGGKQLFAAMCAGCHGADGTGGQRGPNIIGNAGDPIRTEANFRDIIRTGNPGAGMPAFAIGEVKIRQIAAFVHGLRAPASEDAVAGNVAAGQRFFEGPGGCSTCHSISGSGGWLGPDLSDIGARRTLDEIRTALRDPGKRRSSGYAVASFKLTNGSTVRGLVKNENTFSVQVLDFDGRMHLWDRGQIAAIAREAEPLMKPVAARGSEFDDLVAYLSRRSGRKPVSPGKANVAADIAAFEEIARPRSGDWPTYNGLLNGNRYSALDQINSSNVTTLAPSWSFSLGSSRKLEMTPLVMDGVMYVTSVNQAVALDGRTGREIWRYERARSKGLVGDASGGINRGVAVLGNRIFLVTDNAHLLALDRRTGALQWDVEMADSRLNYGATSAPLVVNDLVISGSSGGDEGVRGFIAAFRASTGEEVWRFWTIPKAGEPKSETWIGTAIEHGCVAAWLTGTYDVDARVLYWTTGNPCPDYNGDERKGDNLYSDSVLALDPETGRLKWHYQFTPHDLHDWDASETPVLVDADFRGQPRKLLLQANRNGFFYVLDRTSGKLLLAKPFVKKLTWSSGVDEASGRPVVLPGSVPTPEGTRTCPAVEGASNWMSTAYDAGRKLFYVMALEKCNIFTKSPAVWKAGESYYGGDARNVPGEPGEKVLRAIDLETGRIVWELPQVGPAESWGGVLATAGGVVFFGEDSGAFAAVDSATGKPLWHFQTSELWKASPMTYVAGGKQYVAVAAGGTVLAFALR